MMRTELDSGQGHAFFREEFTESSVDRLQTIQIERSSGHHGLVRNHDQSESSGLQGS